MLNGHFDANVKDYLLALKAGQKPDNKPDIPEYWADATTQIEWMYTKSDGDAVAVEKSIEQLCVSMPELAELLAIEPPKKKPGRKKKAQVPEQPTAPTITGEAPAVPEQVTPEQLCRYSDDDAGNGDAMHALYGNQVLYCGSRGWLYYTGTHWQLDQEGASVKRLAVETLRKRRHAAVDMGKESVVKCTRADERRVNGCVSRFKTLVDINIEEFDNSPDQLNCLNGVLDLRTGALEPHCYLQHFTYCVQVAYDPHATCSEWEEYLQGVVGGGQEVIDYLQMALGYSLTGHTNEECLFYLYGPTRSGKSTLSEIFMQLLPYPLASGADFNSFTQKRDADNQNFDLAPLKPARMVFASESNEYQILNPAKIKALTGGEVVNCAFKHKDHFSYKPQYKVWMLSNEAVNGNPDDDALWGRVRVIEFPHSYLGREDKSKKARLKEPQALAGVLAWAVAGAIKWSSLGPRGLIAPAQVILATKKHRDAIDYVKQWVDECCEPAEGVWTSNEEVMASYTAWCESNNASKKNIKTLSHSLKAKGYETGVQAKVKGVNKRGVGGLKVKPVASEDVSTFWQDDPVTVTMSNDNLQVSAHGENILEETPNQSLPIVTVTPPCKESTELQKEAQQLLSEVQVVFLQERAGIPQFWRDDIAPMRKIEQAAWIAKATEAIASGDPERIQCAITAMKWTTGKLSPGREKEASPLQG